MKVEAPATLDEALACLQAAPLVPLAGGTDLLVHWPGNLEAKAGHYVDLWALDELRGIRRDAEGLTLGALATYWDAIRDSRIREEFPILVQAARQVGAIQIQSRGTWAGNVVNASPAADGVPVLMALDAVVVLASASRRREVPLDAFYTGYRTTVRRADELVVAVRLPDRGNAVQTFVKVGSRRAQAIAKVGLALARSEAGWRVVAASVAPTVVRCRTVEAALDAGDAFAAPEDLLPLLREDVTPIDDLRSTARYREMVLARVLWHAIAEAA
ncbi:MAG: FAD binding domain-containing protein [Gemmatimonadetes bacterium]|nr:FAD binding domain-containing protein [Gemmatimonadota bacterium]